MAFQISPGVNYSEVDLTTVVPSILTTAGAIAGGFMWGPVNKRVLVDSEITLTKTFGNPDANSYTTFFTAASFLAYGNNLQVVRSANNTSYNADSNTSNSNIQVANEDIFQYSYLGSNNGGTYGPFMSRYPGALGNSLTISLVDGGGSYSASWNINGTGIASYVTGAPGTSVQANTANASFDEVHVVVMDTGGLFTGAKNTVLEVFPFLSKGFDAKDSLGNSNYYKNYINNNSAYLWWGSHTALTLSQAGNTITWGNLITGTSTGFTLMTQVQSRSFVGGVDVTPTDGLLQAEYARLANTELYDVSLIPVVGVVADNSTARYVSDNISDVRRDCVVFVSPTTSNLITGTAVVNDRNTNFNKDTSYAVMDSGWKYQYDRYNDSYRWIPLCGDTAGLCVYTDTVTDPWYSPGGYNRGNIKNVVKLNWNPTKTDRDNLYRAQVNPVITQPGLGTLLFGDKTVTAKPSAFDRINVRRLFIVLEKAIATAAKFQLFEFNDAFTRSQFVSLVEPFLRDVQGRRGIIDFQVVCDDTNNTAQVIDSNQFVADIYIKPAKSINFITLNFVATPSGVSFNEVGA